jgi:hypothetical protein
VLSSVGQQLMAQQGQFSPLDAATAAAERAKLDGYLAELDPGLPAYRPAGQVRGTIASVGSDGMKTLMDRWMRSFRTLQPDVRKGERYAYTAGDDEQALPRKAPQVEAELRARIPSLARLYGPAI